MTTYPRTDSQYADAEFLLSRRQYANLTIRSGKGPGYERWAKVFNLKQLSQAVIWLKEHGDICYENLQEKSDAAIASFNALSVQIKEPESLHFCFSVFQRNAQPSPQVMISWVGGHVTNKHLAEIPGTGFLINTQSYGRLHYLPAVKVSNGNNTERILLPRIDLRII